MLAADVVFLALLYLAAINLATAAAFAWDKYCAMRDMWRVPERTLLTMAAAGGTIGALFASQTLRHKTTKQPFRTYLRAIAMVQVVVLAGFAAAAMRGTLT